jgi:hypothetical protein
MNKERRTEPTRAVRSQIALFYEGDRTANLKCVVTEEPVERQLHHLDEDRHNSRVEYNFLPLRADLNVNIENRQLHNLNREIKPDGLANKSAYYFSHGKFAYGYGCCVLGASLAASG